MTELDTHNPTAPKTRLKVSIAARGAISAARLFKRGPVMGTVATQLTIISCGAITGVLSGRLLGPTGRGELAAITLWPTALVFLVSLGVNNSIVFHTGKKRNTYSEIWTSSLIIGAVQSTVVVVLGTFLVPRLLSHYPVHVIQLAVLLCLASPLLIMSGYPANILQGAGDLNRFNIIRVLVPACYATGIIGLLATRTESLGWVVATQIIGYAVAVAIGVSFLSRRLKPTIAASFHTISDLLSFGSKNHLANVTSYFNQRVDQLILSLLIPAQDLGIYAIAVTLTMSLTFVPAAAGVVTLSRASSQSDTAARQTIATSFRASLLWLMIACLGLYTAAPFLIVTVLGPRFTGSILACRILLPGTVALGLNQVLYGGANALGKPLLPTCAESIGLVATAIGLALFVPKYGYLGAAGVSTVAYTVSLVVMLFLSASRLQLGLRDLLFPAPNLAAEPAEVVEA